MSIERGRVNCYDCECNNFCPRIDLLDDKEKEKIQSCSDSEVFDHDELDNYFDYEGGKTMSYAYNSRKKAIKKGLVPKGKKSVRIREAFAKLRAMLDKGERDATL